MKKLGCLLLLFLNVSINSFAQRAQDSLALVALYNSTSGANWTNKTNWLSSEPISKWFGVKVENNRVIYVNLTSNNLTGTIPREIGNLTNLLSLVLVFNNLSGSIPSELANLNNLIQLNLGQNQLNGSIPFGIWNLTKLDELYLSSNQLTGSIPPEVSNLTNISYLNLSFNQLSGNIPVEINSWTERWFKSYSRHIKENIPICSQYSNRWRATTTCNFYCKCTYGLRRL